VEVAPRKQLAQLTVTYSAVHDDVGGDVVGAIEFLEHAVVKAAHPVPKPDHRSPELLRQRRSLAFGPWITPTALSYDLWYKPGKFKLLRIPAIVIGQSEGS
jgi:hypothetical protein